jgi:ankyrin repeat protein
VRNPIFEESHVLDAISKLRRRHHHSHYDASSVEIIEAVTSNNYEALLTKLDGLREGAGNGHDLNVTKAEVASYEEEERGWNVFHYAAHHQSDAIMEKLVDFLDSDCVNGKSRGQEFTALHLAVRGDGDNDRLVFTLLRHPQIDVDVKDSDDWTPLHHACHRGLCKSIVALQNADFCLLNHEGDSPLHLAAANQHTAIFSALFESETFKKKYIRDPSFPEVKDMDGNTLLHLAVDEADNDLIGWCLAFGFRVRSKNNQQMNCMHIAARRGDYSVAVQVLEQARREEDEVLKSFIDCPNSDRATPLYMAAKFGNVKIMELLLDNGAYKDAKTNMHFTPLLAAIRYTQLGPVRLLLRRGANVMARDRLRHFNAILWAVEIQHPEILKVVVAASDLGRR